MLGMARRREQTGPPPPAMLFGMDMRRESLPDDVVDAARKSWLAGEPRQALGLLMRAATVTLITDYGCPFVEGHTEAECAALATTTCPPEISAYFGQLIAQWQQVAYAHRECSPATFDALCRRWEEVSRRG